MVVLLNPCLINARWLGGLLLRDDTARGACKRNIRYLGTPALVYLQAMLLTIAGMSEVQRTMRTLLLAAERGET